MLKKCQNWFPLPNIRGSQKLLYEEPYLSVLLPPTSYARRCRPGSAEIFLGLQFCIVKLYKGLFMYPYCDRKSVFLDDLDKQIVQPSEQQYYISRQDTSVGSQLCLKLGWCCCYTSSTQIITITYSPLALPRQWHGSTEFRSRPNF